MAKKKKKVGYIRTVPIGKILAKPKKTKVDNSILEKYCPFFRDKCKGLNCAFGEKKSEGHFWSGDGEEVLYCKLFEGLTGRLKFEIETSVRQDDN